ARRLTICRRSGQKLPGAGPGMRNGRYGRRSLGVELLDGPAVDPEPEQGLLRLPVAAEDGVAGGALERPAHAGERVAHLVTRLGPAVFQDLPQDRRSVVRVGLEEPGRTVVGALVVVDELARGPPLALREEAVGEDRALHVLG